MRAATLLFSVPAIISTPAASTSTNRTSAVPYSEASHRLEVERSSVISRAFSFRAPSGRAKAASMSRMARCLSDSGVNRM